MKNALHTLLEQYGHTRIRTPLFQSFDHLSRNIHSAFHNEMVKLITPRGDVHVLRYDNTLSALDVMATENLSKIYTAEPVYRHNRQTLQIDERYALSAEVMSSPTTERDQDLVLLALTVLRSLYDESFIFEISHTDWLDAILRREPCLIPLKDDLEGILTKKNPVALKSLLLPLSQQVTHYEDLLIALTAHGPYDTLLKTLRANTYKQALEPLLTALEKTFEGLPPWALNHLYLDLAYPPKLSHYNGIYFQALSLTSNTCLSSGGAYLYKDAPHKGIGFIVYLEEDSNDY